MIKLNKRKLNYLPSSDEVYQYITDHSLRLSKAQNWLIQETSKHPLSAMLISDMEMQLLSNLCYMINAKMTLDIGVYTGYSALSIAEVLPSDGRVLALDITDAYLQDYCIPAWKMANVDSKIDFRLGPAAQTLQIYSRLVLWLLHVLDDNDKQPSTVSIRKLNDFLAKDERVRISFLNVSDGLTIVVKK
ncbi:Catechol O-methyltransferase domain-containing protein 1 [Schistosoma japonicum]|nr:Catechol O-methyltransferase domain-containing protein 1 [Schistosoma japonicum]